MAGLNVRGDLVGNVQDDLDAAASPLALEKEIIERKLNESRQRANPYETELRIKRLAKQAGVSRQEARRLYEEGLAASEVDPEAGISTAQLNAATQTLRDMAGDRQDEAEANRRKKWAAMTYLAGGSDNLNAGNRAMYAALADLPEKERQKSLQYMLPGGNQAAAVDVAEVRGNPELEAKILEIQSRNQLADAQLQQNGQQFTERMDAMREENAFSRQQDLAKQEAQSQKELARMQGEFNLQMAQLEARLKGDAAEWGARKDIAKLPIDAEIAEREAKQQAIDKAMAEAKEAQARALPGGEATYQMQQGNYKHPLVQELMKQKAREADKSWFGFYKDDAERLNATLIGLGVKDPAVRQMLVEEYGLSPGGSAAIGVLGFGAPGRGTQFSRYLHGTPEY